LHPYEYAVQADTEMPKAEVSVTTDSSTLLGGRPTRLHETDQTVRELFDGADSELEATRFAFNHFLAS
jgi:hypothetical protein